MVTATLNVSNWTLFRASFMSSKWESIESTVRCTVSMLFYCICVGMVFTAGTTPASTIWNGNSRWSAFYNVRPSFCTKIIFTIYQTFCSFFLNWKSYAGFPNVWSFDREKKCIGKKTRFRMENARVHFILRNLFAANLVFFRGEFSCIRIHLQKNRLNCSRVDISMPSIALIWITAASISPRGFITFLFFFSVLNFLQFNLLLFAHTFTFTFVNWAEIYRISIVYGSSKWIPEITVCCALVALNCISNDILYFISNFRLHYHSQLNKMH